MLKSIFSTFLMVVLLGTTSGISVYKHYCGDFLEGVSIFIQSNPCAGEGGEEACSAGKEMSCCDDETEYYQLEIDLVKTSLPQVSFEIQHTVNLFGVYQESILNEESQGLHYLDDPPIIANIPIYKKLMQYTFYG